VNGGGVDGEKAPRAPINEQMWRRKGRRKHMIIAVKQNRPMETTEQGG
jgi:hypothetical protein